MALVTPAVHRQRQDLDLSDVETRFDTPRRRRPGSLGASEASGSQKGDPAVRDDRLAGGLTAHPYPVACWLSGRQAS